MSVYLGFYTSMLLIFTYLQIGVKPRFRQAVLSIPILVFRRSVEFHNF